MVLVVKATRAIYLFCRRLAYQPLQMPYLGDMVPGVIATIANDIQWATAKRARTPKWYHLEILLFCVEIKTFVIRGITYVVNHRKKWYCIIFGTWVNCIYFVKKAKITVNWHHLSFQGKRIIQEHICAILLSNFIETHVFLLQYYYFRRYIFVCVRTGYLY